MTELVALLGDDRGHRSHRELGAPVHPLVREFVAAVRDTAVHA